MLQGQFSNSTDAPSVDLSTLIGRCLGNFKIVERVLATFRESGKTDLTQLKTALEDANYSAIVEIAHRFKGAASNVSATRITQLLVQTEQLGHEKNQIGLTQIVTELSSAWDSFTRFAQALVPSVSSVKQNPIMRKCGS